MAFRCGWTISPRASWRTVPSLAATAGQPRARRAGPQLRATRRRAHHALPTLVRDHLDSFYQAIEQGFASAPLPKFVKQEFGGHLDCAVLCLGAALLVCDPCDTTKLIA
jgi:hypothetical protein